MPSTVGLINRGAHIPFRSFDGIHPLFHNRFFLISPFFVVCHIEWNIVSIEGITHKGTLPTA